MGFCVRRWVADTPGLGQVSGGEFTGVQKGFLCRGGAQTGLDSGVWTGSWCLAGSSTIEI